MAHDFEIWNQGKQEKATMETAMMATSVTKKAWQTIAITTSTISLELQLREKYNHAIKLKIRVSSIFPEN